jgi:cellulose synthase (UDP-forming)
MTSERSLPAIPEPRRGGAAGLLLVVALYLLVLSACTYMFMRSFFVQELRGDLQTAALVGLFLAEAFVVFQSVAYAINCLYSYRNPPPPRAQIGDWTKAPRVAVLMPARHEPYEVLDRTLTCLSNLDYPNKAVYFLDDSSDEEYLRDAEALALKHGVRLFRRAVRHGAKAGIINDCVKSLDEKYVAIFDCDQNPNRGFLKDLVSILEADPRLAFVQTPQYYTNTEGNPIAFGANIQHCIFYEYICEGKSARNAMIMCGTNVVIRREALQDAGGLDEASVTEDFSTTIEWHRRGWKSYFLNRTSVFGSGPETLASYLKQQYRWARGNLGVFRRLLGLLARRPGALSFWQWWEHLATGSYYLIGAAYTVMMLLPVLYLLFGVKSFYIRSDLYLYTFIPYFCLALLVFYASMRLRHYSLGQLLNVVLLGFISFPIFLRAAFGALIGSRAGFSITDKRGAVAAVPYRVVWPQILLWTLNLVAILWGLNTLALERDWSVVVAVIWASYHFLLLSSVFYYRLAGVRPVPPEEVGELSADPGAPPAPPRGA